MVAYAVFVNQQRLLDWWKLRGYEPSPAVVEVAERVTMTNTGRHLWYVNKPVIVGGAQFNADCPIAVEKTVVLGCYKTGDRGIYVYHVTDQRLNGVVEVTSAHELLHAAYDRLSGAEHRRIDALLQDFYTKRVNDQRIKDTIAAYEKSEPNALANEMHSIFATEIPQLSPELETYYKRYFVSRNTIVAMAARYTGEFTSRRQQVAAYDQTLGALKTTIEESQKTLKTQYNSLLAQQESLDSLQRSSVSAYNASVDAFNQQVGAYNNLLQTTQSQIDEYNSIIEKRNALALEERQLAQAMSSTALPEAQ